MMYRLFIPKQSVGANLVYFDLFNASGSPGGLIVSSVIPVNSGAVAHSGVVSVDLHLTRTTAVGTGGTAATREGTDLTAATFSHLSGQQVLHPSVTARLTPSGGATAGATLAWLSILTEELVGGYNSPPNMLQTPCVVAVGTGLRVAQGSVASTGTIGFDVIFRFDR